MTKLKIFSIDEALQQDIVHGIIDVTGRDVTFNCTSGLSVCPTCSGSDPFCVTCGGNKFTDTPYTRSIKCSVRWTGANQKIYRPQGQTVEGDCTLVVPALDDDIDRLLYDVRSVIVDNKKCVIKKFYGGGSPINRVYVVLRQDDTTDGHRVG